MLWQSESLSGRESSSPRCHRRTASSVWRAAHCTVHRGPPPLRRHRPVSPLVEASRICCSGIRLIYQQVSLSPPGGTPERSAPFQKCGLALLSRLTILASMVVPSFSSCRVSPPRGVDQCLLRRKNPFQIFFPGPVIYILYIMINDYYISRSLSWWHSFGSISNASTT